MATFEQRYIQWVQRTLNRELDSELVTSGVVSDEYREAVETFQLIHDLPVTGDVGPADQNKMIKANHKRQMYVEWAQNALHEVGARERGSTGVMDSETILNIKSFQAYQGLNDDGWIGAKTEMALIDASGMLPFGHIKKPGPVPRRPKRIFYDNPRPTPAALPVDKTANRIISVNYYDAFYGRSAHSGTDRRRRVCVLGKLKQKHGINDEFPVSSRLSYSYHGSSKYRTGDSLLLSAREYLTQRVSHMRPEERLDPVAGRVLINDLMQMIEDGLRTLERYERGVFTPSSHAHFEPLVDSAARLVAQRKRESSSILSCFK